MNTYSFTNYSSGFCNLNSKRQPDCNHDTDSCLELFENKSIISICFY